MTRDDFISWAIGKGYVQGTKSKTSSNLILYAPNDRSKRFKVSKIAVRLECKDNDGNFFRIRSNYLKNLSINDKGLLVGLKY